MRSPTPARSIVQVYLGLLLAGPSAGCDGVVGADLTCDKICMTSVGPTVPGLGPMPDAGALPDGAASQPAQMDFNVPLQQLSSAVAGVEVEAHLTSLKLTGVSDLAFVDSLQVIVYSGAPDAGAPKADASPASGTPGPTPDAASPGTIPAAPADAGANPTMANELPSIQTSGCLPGGPGYTVARYRKPATALTAVGTSLDLALIAPEADLYPCLRGSPAKFSVVLAILPAYLPATATPLSLKACIDAHASASYP